MKLSAVALLLAVPCAFALSKDHPASASLTEQGKHVSSVEASVSSDGEIKIETPETKEQLADAQQRIKELEAENAKLKEHPADAKGKKLNLADEDSDEDVALDELEAMTIQNALQKKNWGPPPAVNCAWTPYEKEGKCSKTCGKGEQVMKRKKSPNAAHGGRACTGQSTKIEDCNTEECPTTTTTTTTTEMFTTPAGAFHMAGVSAPVLMAMALFASA